MVRVPDQSQLKRLLDQFGVVVIPNDVGGYEHNVAIYLVGRDGKLARIFDFDDAKPVLEYAKKML